MRDKRCQYFQSVQERYTGFRITYFTNACFSVLKLHQRPVQARLDYKNLQFPQILWSIISLFLFFKISAFFFLSNSLWPQSTSDLGNKPAACKSRLTSFLSHILGDLCSSLTQRNKIFYSPVSKEVRSLISLLTKRQIHSRQWWKREDQNIFHVSAAALLYMWNIVLFVSLGYQSQCENSLDISQWLQLLYQC